MIHVVAGLIYRDGKLLVCQRHKDAAHALKWEFPGGKVEAGESDESALRHEMREELGIEIGESALVHRHEHAYPNGPAVSLRFYGILAFGGEVENRIFHRIAWVRLDQLKSLDFLEGDIPLLDKLAADGPEFLASTQGFV